MHLITNTYNCWRRRLSSSSFSDLSALSSVPPPPPRSDDAREGLGLAGRMLLDRDECAPAAGGPPDVEPMLSRLPAALLAALRPSTGDGRTGGLAVAAVQHMPGFTKGLKVNW